MAGCWAKLQRSGHPIGRGNFQSPVCKVAVATKAVHGESGAADKAIGNRASFY